MVVLLVHARVSAQCSLLIAIHVQISDLGLARKAGLFVPHEGGKFPIKWTAPEALKYSVRLDTSLQLVLPVFVVLNWEMFCLGVVSILPTVWGTEYANGRWNANGRKWMSDDADLLTCPI